MGVLAEEEVDKLGVEEGEADVAQFRSMLLDEVEEEEAKGLEANVTTRRRLKMLLICWR